MKGDPFQRGQGLRDWILKMREWATQILKPYVDGPHDPKVLAKKPKLTDETLHGLDMGTGGAFYFLRPGSPPECVDAIEILKLVRTMEMQLSGPNDPHIISVISKQLGELAERIANVRPMASRLKKYSETQAGRHTSRVTEAMIDRMSHLLRTGECRTKTDAAKRVALDMELNPPNPKKRQTPLGWKTILNAYHKWKKRWNNPGFGNRLSQFLL